MVTSSASPGNMHEYILTTHVIILPLQHHANKETTDPCQRKTYELQILDHKSNTDKCIPGKFT